MNTGKPKAPERTGRLLQRVSAVPKDDIKRPERQAHHTGPGSGHPFHEEGRLPLDAVGSRGSLPFSGVQICLDLRIREPGEQDFRLLQDGLRGSGLAVREGEGRGYEVGDTGKGTEKVPGFIPVPGLAQDRPARGNQGIRCENPAGIPVSDRSQGRLRLVQGEGRDPFPRGQVVPLGFVRVRRPDQEGESDRKSVV